ncbi:MAG: hypothetical protein ACRYFS_08595 [Janthinobacterium lividum]
MFLKILDHFWITAELKDRSSGQLDPLAEGLWFILEPEQTPRFSLPPLGQLVTITRPDGSIIVTEMIAAQIRHSMLAIQLKGAESHRIPRLSVVAFEI